MLAELISNTRKGVVGQKLSRMGISCLPRRLLGYRHTQSMAIVDWHRLLSGTHFFRRTLDASYISQHRARSSQPFF